jgi:hypothetical protein
MKSRQIIIAIVILGTVWHTAAAQPKKKVEVGAPPPEGILAGTSVQSDGTSRTSLAPEERETLHAIPGEIN